MIAADEVMDLWKQRKNTSSVLLRQMRAVRAAYNGDLVVPLPEMDRREKAAVANLVTQGIDQLGSRIASNMPSCDWPSMDPGKREADRRATTRSRAQQGWWDANRMNLKLRHRARFLIGYSSAPVSITLGKNAPKWEVHNPLTVYPSMKSQVDDLIPLDVVTESNVSRAWLKKNGYEGAMLALRDKEPRLWRNDDLFTILTYRDCHEIVQVLCAPEQHNRWGETAFSYGVTAQILHQMDNKTGITPFVIPDRITLDRAQGQFDQMLGMYAMQAKLMALEVIAVEKGIFPDTYLVSRPGEQARFIDGPFDGRTGKVNVVQGGDVKNLADQGSYQTGQVIDRLERAQRLTSGTPQEFGGESGTNIRTGRRGDAVLSAVIDMPIQEAQELLAASLECENEIAAAIESSYYAGRTRHTYVTEYDKKKKESKAKQVTYTPDTIFRESTANKVFYSATGVDANGLVIGIGQRVGMESMSRQTAAEMDPLIADPQMEQDRIVGESLDRAVLESLKARAMEGTLPLEDAARIQQLVVQEGKPLMEAVMQAQTEAQERQAQQAPPGDPGTNPGLNMPGMGSEQPQAPPFVSEPTPSMQNLGDVFARVRQPAMTVPLERGA